MKKYCIGVDMGTTSTKAVLFLQDGTFVSKESVEYPLYTPTADTAEQNPKEILEAVLVSIKNVMENNHLTHDQILFVSFSAAMHSVIAVDQSGEPLTNCITWADNRSSKWAKKINTELNGHDIYMRTGTPVHPMSPLPKLAWLHEEYPEICANTHKFISIKEFVFYHLFNQYIVDYSIASATGLLNLESLKWDKEALQIAGITEEKLSILVDTSHSVTGLKESIASRIHLSSDIPFVLGANDGVLSNLGVNATAHGDIAVTIGTSGAIRAMTNKPKLDPKGRTFCYYLSENYWVIGGPVNNGGKVFQWTREIVTDVLENGSNDHNSFKTLSEMAASVQPGAEGLIFHPYLAGERAPLWNAEARGSFFGLGFHHTKAHFVRAALEGVLYNLNTVLLALIELTGRPKRIQATGGFARTQLWRQMMADIFNEEIYIPESYESSCLGAVVIGLKSLGYIESIEEVSSMVGASHYHKPIPENVSVYREIMPIYLRLIQLYKEEFESISQFQEKYSK